MNEELLARLEDAGNRLEAYRQHSVAACVSDARDVIREAAAYIRELEAELSHECPKCEMALRSAITQDGCVGCEVRALRGSVPNSFKGCARRPR